MANKLDKILKLHFSDLSLLDEQEVKTLLSTLTASDCEILLHSWSFRARPEQIPPKLLKNGKPWQNWLYLAGRGAGKTRTGAEWVREKIKGGAMFGGLIAPTTADIRKVMVEGPSGILACSWENDIDIHGELIGRPDYSPSLAHRLTWANGAVCHCFSGEEPDRLRGPQHEFIWADELAAWPYVQDAWDMAMFGLRIGENPQVMISTTPRPIQIIRELIKSPYTMVTRSSTLRNRANLSEVAVERMISRYAGTRIGRQEMDAELLEEMEGALWNREMIENCSLKLRKVPEFLRIVIAIDPAISDTATSNLTGIIAAALGKDGYGYVLADLSGQYSPDGWAKQAISLYDSLGADRIIAEGNQGGNMVRHTIETVRKNIPISIVHASRSKQARAEPVAALYEQRKIIHIEPFPELEDQMCTWEPLTGDPSPDRLDAMVWAFFNLMLGHYDVPLVAPIFGGTARVIPGQ